MTVKRLRNRLTEYFSWPYYGQWGGCGLLLIVITVLAILILGGRTQAKNKD
ncbi:MAG: hypothetical protein ACYTFW_11515 [Planctomycetota bacterium]|jgi:hypothetical protein